MFLYDIVNDKKQFQIEAQVAGLRLNEFIYIDEYVLTKVRLPYKFASVRMSFELVSEIDTNFIKDTIFDFVSENSFKKYFFSSNFLSKKVLMDALFFVKKKIKFHFDTDPNTFKLSKSGFFKGKTTLIHIFKDRSKIYFFKLIDCDNVSRLEMFDYKKPYRNQRQGMMPPKLTTFMLNFARGANMIYDPFCGTGTTLMLSNLMGINSKGSDILEENISGSLENIQYISNKLELENKCTEVYLKDANLLSSQDLKDVDYIVTEGFLGKPKSGKEQKHEIIKEVTNLSNFYLDFFKNLHKNINQPLTVIITLPVVKNNGKFYFLDKLFDEIGTTGFKLSNLCPKHKDYMYKRTDQKVFRLVCKFESL